MHLLAAAGCPSVVLFSRDSDPALVRAARPSGHGAPPPRPCRSRRSRRDGRGDLHAAGRGRRTGRRLMADDQPAHRHGLAAPDGVPLPQRYWAILTIALGLTLAVLDGAIANVALPTIARDLDASPASSIWVVNAYQLAVTISLLPLASLGDIYGYRRVYQYGLILFTVASLGCAMSDSLTDADRRARHPGLRRGRHHERQRRAGALHLPAPLARPRRRPQRDDRLHRIGGRPHGRRRHPVRRTMALAVRRERADRRAGDPDRLPRPATTRAAPACGSTHPAPSGARSPSASWSARSADWATARAPVLPARSSASPWCSASSW